MSIHYRIVEHKNTLPTAKSEYSSYAVPVLVGRVTTKELAEDIADRTALHRVDVQAVLDVLSTVVIANLKKGLGVQLGELGSFAVRLKSLSTDTKEEFKVENITNSAIRYTPSAVIKAGLKTIAYRNIEELANTEPDPGTEGGGDI